MLWYKARRLGIYKINKTLNMECTECGSSNVSIVATDTEIFRRRAYDITHYKCDNCGYIFIIEPDWDSMPGGHDDY